MILFGYSYSKQNNIYAILSKQNTTKTDIVLPVLLLLLTPIYKFNPTHVLCFWTRHFTPECVSVIILFKNGA